MTIRRVIGEGSGNLDRLGFFGVHWQHAVHGPVAFLPLPKMHLPWPRLNPCPSGQQPSTMITVPLRQTGSQKKKKKNQEALSFQWIKCRGYSMHVQLTLVCWSRCCVELVQYAIPAATEVIFACMRLIQPNKLYILFFMLKYVTNFRINMFNYTLIMNCINH